MKQYFAELSQEENRSIFGGIEYEWSEISSICCRITKSSVC